MRNRSRHRAEEALLDIGGTREASSACAISPEEMQAYCSRYAAEQMAYGVHENLNAYREDLMPSCMAMNGIPYASSAQASSSGGARASAD